MGDKSPKEKMKKKKQHEKELHQREQKKVINLQMHRQQRAAEAAAVKTDDGQHPPHRKAG